MYTVPHKQSQQTPTPRSPHQTVHARMADQRTLPLPLPHKAAPSSRHRCNTCGCESKQGETRSERDDHFIWRTFFSRTNGFVRRFGSLAGRWRASSLTTARPYLPGSQIATGAGKDSTTERVFSDSEAVGAGGRRRSAFGSRFPVARVLLARSISLLQSGRNHSF